jgi:hypothetical protein
MSCSAVRLSRKNRALCFCGHRAVFFVRTATYAAIRARGDHPLCARCWRAARAREVARQMAAAHARRLAYVPGPFALL